MVQIYISSTCETKKLYFEVKTTLNEGITYMNVISMQEDKIGNLIHNNTPFRLSISSVENSIEPVFTVDPMTNNQPYIQKYPEASGNQIKIIVRLNQGKDPEQNMSKSFKIDYTRLQKLKGYRVSEDIIMLVSIVFEKDKKVIKFDFSDTMKTPKNKVNEIGINYRFNIPEINISLSYFKDGSQGTRKEILLMSLFELYFMLNIGKEMLDLDVNFNRIQLDNCSSIKTEYPVVLCNFEKPEKRGIRVNNVLNFSTRIQTGGSTSNLYFNYLNMDLNGLKISVEEEFMHEVIKMYEFMFGIYSQSRNTFSPLKLIKNRFYREFSDKEQLKMFTREWTIIELDSSRMFLFFENLKLPSIALEASYYQDGSRLLENDFDVISIVGLALGGFEDARIIMNGIEMK